MIIEIKVITFVVGIAFGWLFTRIFQDNTKDVLRRKINDLEFQLDDLIEILESYAPDEDEDAIDYSDLGLDRKKRIRDVKRFFRSIE